MANDRDAEMYPRNADLIVCRPSRRQVNGTTGVEETVPLTGLTDLRYWISATETAAGPGDAIHADLVVDLVEVGVTAVYHGVQSGADKAARISSPDGTVLYEHWQSVSGDYHEVGSFIWRTKRPAE